MQTSVATTRPTRVVCLTCGAIKKTGKLSCCARGGSWFGKCGGAGNTNREHTWSEGLQACEARQAKAVMGLQQTAVEHKNYNSSDDAVMGINSKTGSVATHIISSKPVNAPMSVATTIPVRMNTQTATSTITPTRMQMGPIAHVVNRVSTDLDSKASADIVSLHTSTSTPLAVQGLKNVSTIVVDIGILLVTLVCSCLEL